MPSIGEGSYSLGGLEPTEYETPNYKLCVGYSLFDGPSKGLRCYVLVNKQNGIREGEGTTLAGSIGFMHMSQAALNEANEAHATGSGVVAAGFEMPTTDPH